MAWMWIELRSQRLTSVWALITCVLNVNQSAIILLSQIQWFVPGEKKKISCRVAQKACQSLSYNYNTGKAHLCNWSTQCHFSSKLVSSKWLTHSLTCSLDSRVTDTSSLSRMFLDTLDKKYSVEIRVWQGGVAQESLSTFTVVKDYRVWCQSVGSIKKGQQIQVDVCFFLFVIVTFYEGIEWILNGC